MTSVEAPPRSSGRRTVLTPEGVPLNWELGDRSERAAAFMIDFLLIIGLGLLTFFIVRLTFVDVKTAPWAILLFLIGAFLLRSFYFTIAELMWRGRTPGKFVLGLRVVNAGGGPLTPGAVAARNLVREVELFLPLGLVFAPEAMGWPQWASLIALAWFIGVGGFPLFNRDRQRIGDLLGGTWVIKQPKLELLPDLSAARSERLAPGLGITFERAQVEVYGIKELQTLESVLRTDGSSRRDAQAAVARTIQDKIGWRGGTVDPEKFLAAYYGALREHLESRLALGERLEDKAEAARRRTGADRR